MLRIMIYVAKNRLLKFYQRENMKKRILEIKLYQSLGTHLFVKVTRAGDSEVTFVVFESSCHLLLQV